MLYLFYGEDTYRSRKKVREITDRFYAMAGGRESAVHVALSECSQKEAELVITTGSLFRSKRLVVLEDPSEAAPDTASYIEAQMPLCRQSDDIYVMWDRAPAAGSTGLLALAVASAAKVQVFKRLGAEGAARFLDNEARARGISLSSLEKRRLLANFTGDSWSLIQQLEKSALLANRVHVDGERISSSAEGPQTDRMVFALTDAYGLGERTKAWHLYTALIRTGVEPEKIFWRLLSHARTVLAVSSLAQRGISAGDIPRIAGVHPFVAKKALAVSARISTQNLKERHARLVALDFQAKQSRGDMTLGLERILLSI